MNVFKATDLSVLRVVHCNRRIAFWRGVYISVITYGSDGLHGVASHAGHGDCGQTVSWVIIKDVLMLAVQQQHHRLLERGTQKKTVNHKTQVDWSTIFYLTKRRNNYILFLFLVIAVSRHLFKYSSLKTREKDFNQLVSGPWPALYNSNTLFFFW